MTYSQLREDQGIGDPTDHSIDNEQRLVDYGMLQVLLHQPMSALLPKNTERNRLRNEVIAALRRDDIADVNQLTDERFRADIFAGVGAFQAEELNDDARPLWRE